jgi:hypothetical protein
MDPVSLIVAALSAGAAAALKPTAERAVLDAYEGLRTVIADRYTRARETVGSLEARPESKARKAAVEEDLADEGAGSDKQLLQHAQQVLKAIQEHAPEAAGEAAVDLDTVRIGANLNISDIVASGTGVRVRRTDVAKDVNIRGVRTDTGEGS